MTRYRGRHVAASQVARAWRRLRLSLLGALLGVGALTIAGAFLSTPYGPSYVPPVIGVEPAQAQPTTTGPASKGSKNPTRTHTGRSGDSVTVPGARPARLGITSPPMLPSPPGRVSPADTPLPATTLPPVTTLPPPELTPTTTAEQDTRHEHGPVYDHHHPNHGKGRGSNPHDAAPEPEPGQCT